eukprot:scaffold10248_cov65-Phaeocystis_antarctica.AAC.9
MQSWEAENSVLCTRSATPTPCVTPSSLALHDDGYRLPRLNSRDVAEGHRVHHGRAIEDQLHALCRGVHACESAGIGAPRPPLADEGGVRPGAPPLARRPRARAAPTRP